MNRVATRAAETVGLIPLPSHPVDGAGMTTVLGNVPIVAEAGCRRIVRLGEVSEMKLRIARKLIDGGSDSMRRVRRSTWRTVQRVALRRYIRSLRSIS